MVCEVSFIGSGGRKFRLRVSRTWAYHFYKKNSLK